MSGLKPTSNPALADVEQLALGPIDRLLDLARILVADPGDLAGRGDEVAQNGLALDDPGVLDGVDGGRGLVGQARQVRAAADGLELLGAFERLGHGDDVDRLALVKQLEHGRVDGAVGRAVEVLGAEELGDLDDRVTIDEDRAEDGLLGFRALGRQAIDQGGTRCDGICDRPSVADRAPLGVHEGGAIRPNRPPIRRPCWPIVVGSVDSPQSRRRMTPMSLPWMRTSW